MIRSLLLAGAVAAAFSLGQISTTSPSSRLAWDAVTTDVQGNPETVYGYEAAVSAAGVDLNSGGAPLTIAAVEGATTTEVNISQLMAGLPNGSYRYWVRAIDDAGNRSPWAGPLDLEFDGVAPAPPGGIRVIVNVSVTVPNG